MKIINVTRKWILNFDEITKFFQRFQSKTIEWKWIEFENLTFLTFKKFAINVMNMFDHDFNFSIETFTDASKWNIEIYIRQLQNDEMKFILFDSYNFTSIQRNYDTYKKKLFVIVHFIKKHEHYFNAKNISIIHTNYKFLVEFMNVKKHENIYAHWINKFKMHNIKLKYIENEKNVVANDLSRIIYNVENCESNQFVKNLYQKTIKHVNDDEWFWKTKQKYRDMFKKLSNENRKKRIEKYDNKIVSKIYHTTCYEKEMFSTCFVDWITFKKTYHHSNLMYKKLKKIRFEIY